MVCALALLTTAFIFIAGLHGNATSPYHKAGQRRSTCSDSGMARAET